MQDRTIVVAALIVGGAIIAASMQARARFTLSSAGNNIAWRMDTWSGQIDICAAAYLAEGPLVRCGTLVVGNPGLPNPAAPAQPDAGGADTPAAQPAPLPPGQAL